MEEAPLPPAAAAAGSVSPRDGGGASPRRKAGWPRPWQAAGRVSAPLWTSTQRLALRAASHVQAPRASMAARRLTRPLLPPAPPLNRAALGHVGSGHHGFRACWQEELSAFLPGLFPSPPPPPGETSALRNGRRVDVPLAGSLIRPLLGVIGAGLADP